MKAITALAVKCMDATAIREWIKRLKIREQRTNRIFAALSLLAATLVLFFTFWFTYAIVWFGSWGVSATIEMVWNKKVHLSHEWVLILSGIFLVLLFVQHIRTDPSHWGDYPSRNYASSPALQWRAGLGGALGTMLLYPGASANMIADILLTGPRLTMGAWKFEKQARQAARLDDENCASLLAFLVSRPMVVSYDELRDAGWENWLPQLRSINGVNFLERGLSLSQDLRFELAGKESEQSNAPV